MRWALACGLVATTGAAVFACGGSSASPDDDPLALPNRVDGGSDAIADAPVVVDDAGRAGVCDGSASCERIVFTTSARFVGRNLGGLAGADKKCMDSAAASTLPTVRDRRFVAWLSTSQTAASARLVHGTAPYKKPNGTVIVTGWTDLTDGNLGSGIDEDENGAQVGGEAWTGTAPDGSNGPDQCDAWTATGNDGRTGNVGGNGQGWTSSASRPCTQDHHLYCFEE